MGLSLYIDKLKKIGTKLIKYQTNLAPNYFGKKLILCKSILVLVCSINCPVPKLVKGWYYRKLVPIYIGTKFM